jgi:general stress protein 26
MGHPFDWSGRMKIAAQRGDELTRMARLIDGMSVAMLTLASHDGHLVSRPMAPLAMDGDGAIWFFVDRTEQHADQLRSINLSFSDASRSIYVSISGHGEIIGSRERIAEMWTPLAKPWFPGGAESENLALLKLVAHRIEYWDAPHSRVVRLLALAASMVAGKPVGLGEHHSMIRVSSEPYERVPTQPIV